METTRQRSSLKSPCIKPLSCTVFSLLLLLCWSCNEDDGDLLTLDTVVESKYTINVGNSQGYGGTETIWRQDIGHVELGPEDDQTGAIASFWMTMGPQCFDYATSSIDTSCQASYFFYSVQEPWQAIGNQGAYSYSSNGGSVNATFGKDRNGTRFIEGEATVFFSRIPPAFGPFVPEDITVQVTFTALDR